MLFLYIKWESVNLIQFLELGDFIVIDKNEFNKYQQPTLMFSSGISGKRPAMESWDRKKDFLRNKYAVNRQVRTVGGKEGCCLFPRENSNGKKGRFLQIIVF